MSDAPFAYAWCGASPSPASRIAVGLARRPGQRIGAAEAERIGWAAAGHSQALMRHSKLSVVPPAGQRIGAAEAERIGLVSRVVPAAELMAEARKVRIVCAAGHACLYTTAITCTCLPGAAIQMQA